MKRESAPTDSPSNSRTGSESSDTKSRTNETDDDGGSESDASSQSSDAHRPLHRPRRQSTKPKLQRQSKRLRRRTAHDSNSCASSDSSQSLFEAAESTKKSKRKAPVANELSKHRNDDGSESDAVRAPKKKAKASKKRKLNPYYTNKQNQAMKAQERFRALECNAQGQRIIKLPINTNCTEYSSGTVFVTHFGRIPSEKAKANRYCDKDYIYPIGLRAYRKHLSYVDPRRSTIYRMEILDDGLKGPKFRVYAEDDRDNKMVSSSATQPWQTIIDRISKRANELDCAGKRDSHGTSGKRYLGIRDYLVMGIIELLPNAHKCTKYWKTQRKHNLPPKPFFQNIESRDICIQ